MTQVAFNTAAEAQQRDLCQALVKAKLSRVDDPGTNAYFDEDGVWTVICSPTHDDPHTIAQRLNRAGWMMRSFSARLVYSGNVGKVAQVIVRLEQRR